MNHRLLIGGAMAIVLVLAAVGIQRPDLWRGWFGQSENELVLTISGNIEAHESVLGFKTIQSQIAELPFDEGQWVKAGTVVARADDADYRQQAKLNAAALAVQQSALASVEQNLIATQKTVVPSENLVWEDSPRIIESAHARWRWL